MAVSYLNTYQTGSSTDLTVQVFPSAKRTAVQPLARVMTEATTTDRLNKLLDEFSITIGNTTIKRIGYVQTDTYDANAEFIFNIYGYMFIVAKGSYITDLFSSVVTGTNIYGVITLNTTGAYIELQGQDQNSQYTGVGFVTDADVTTTVGQHYVKLLQKTSDGWEIPAESHCKFKSRSVQFVIDGGEITNT